MIEQGFNYADSIIKEMSDFFETWVENLEPKEEKQKILQLPRNPLRKVLRNANRKTPALVL